MPRTLPTRKKILFAFFILLIGAVGAALGLGIAIKMKWLPPHAEERIYAMLGRQPEKRLFILGDSFLSWWPIEECLHRQLRFFCRDRQIGLVNTAVGGFGPYEYRERMQTVGVPFRPQLVLLFYYVGNDLTDVAYRNHEIPRSVEPQPTPASAKAIGSLISLIETSAHAQTSLEEFDWDAMRKKGIDDQIIQSAQDRIRNPQAEGVRYVNPYLLSVALHQPEYIVDNVLMERDKAKEGWIKSQSILTDTIQKAAEIGAKVWVIAIPHTVQVNDSHIDFYRRCTFELDDRLLASTTPQTLLADFCAQQNVPFIDLLPLFKADGRELYWHNDDHLNEFGHEIAWREVRRQILDPWADSD